MAQFGDLCDQADSPCRRLTFERGHRVLQRRPRPHLVVAAQYGQLQIGRLLVGNTIGRHIVPFVNLNDPYDEVFDLRDTVI